MARTKKEIIEKYIENASDDEIIELGIILDIWYGILEYDSMTDDWEMYLSDVIEDPVEASRATFFGDIKSWGEGFIGRDAYGNLYSRTKREYADVIRGYVLADMITYYLDDIYGDLPRELQDELEANEDDDKGSYNRKPAKKSPAKKSAPKKTPAKPKTSTKTVKTAPKKTVKRR